MVSIKPNSFKQYFKGKRKDCIKVSFVSTEPFTEVVLKSVMFPMAKINEVTNMELYYRSVEHDSNKPFTCLFTLPHKINLTQGKAMFKVFVKDTSGEWSK